MGGGHLKYGKLPTKGGKSIDSSFRQTSFVNGSYVNLLRGQLEEAILARSRPFSYVSLN